jgi:nitrogen fixation-related uncharacterized protein
MIWVMVGLVVAVILGLIIFVLWYARNLEFDDH